MKYTLKPRPNGGAQLFRYDEDRGLPTNAEFEMWCALEKAYGTIQGLMKQLNTAKGSFRFDDEPLNDAREFLREYKAAEPKPGESITQ